MEGQQALPQQWEDNPEGLHSEEHQLVFWNGYFCRYSWPPALALGKSFLRCAWAACLSPGWMSTVPLFHTRCSSGLTAQDTTTALQRVWVAPCVSSHWHHDLILEGRVGSQCVVGATYLMFKFSVFIFTSVSLILVCINQLAFKAGETYDTKPPPRSAVNFVVCKGQAILLEKLSWRSCNHFCLYSVASSTICQRTVGPGKAAWWRQRGRQSASYSSCWPLCISAFSLQAQGGIVLLRELTVAPLHKATPIVLMASTASPGFLKILFILTLN